MARIARGCVSELFQASLPNSFVDYVIGAQKIFVTLLHGLQKGDLCTCGDSFAKHGLTADSACNLPCAGNGGMKCGGNLANSVYSTLCG